MSKFLAELLVAGVIIIPTVSFTTHFADVINDKDFTWGGWACFVVIYLAFQAYRYASNWVDNNFE